MRRIKDAENPSRRIARLRGHARRHARSLHRFIESYNNASWMEEKFAKGDGKIGDITPLGGASTYHVWCTNAEDCDSSPPPDAYDVERCIKEIESGKYHAIVFVDFSNNAEMENFERDLGSHIVPFACGCDCLPCFRMCTSNAQFWKGSCCVLWSCQW